jgi:hypothetical protein
MGGENGVRLLLFTETLLEFEIGYLNIKKGVF